MKATRAKKFEPVILTLETQEEVDKIHALFNVATINKVLELDDAWKMTKPFVKDFNRWFNKLINLLK